MGCHTWFSVPYKTDKNEILKIAQSWIDTSDISDGHKKMYQWAIDNEIEEPVCELASYSTDCTYENNWVLYKDAYDYNVEKYNLENNTSIDKYDQEACKKANIKSYSNEPRIGGYPDTIITSYDKMVKFMEDGFIDNKGKHYSFYYDEDKKESFMNDIKEFFENFSDGIITFG